MNNWSWSGDRMRGLRNGIAIGLILLSILCLVWTPVINVRVEKIEEDAVETFADRYDLSNGEANAYFAANRAMNSLRGRKGYTFFDLRSITTATWTLVSIYEKTDEEAFNPLEVDSALAGVSRYSADYQDEYDKEYGKQKAMAVSFSLITNALFFLTIAVGLAAVVFSVTGRSRTMHILFAGMTVLCTAASIALFLYMNGKILHMYEASGLSDQESPLVIGAGLILTPVLALLACILFASEDSDERPARAARSSASDDGDEYMYNEIAYDPTEPDTAYSKPAQRSERPAPAAPAWGAPAREPERPAAPARSANAGWQNAVPAARPAPAAPAWEEPERPAAPARPGNAGWQDAAPVERPARPATNGGWQNAAPVERPSRPATNGGWQNAAPVERPARPATNGGWQNAAPVERPVRPAANTGWQDAAPVERPARPAANTGWTDAPKVEPPAAVNRAEPVKEPEPQPVARPVADERPAAVTWADPAEDALPVAEEQPQPAVQESIWYCHVCGTKNRPGANFCPNCGTKRS